MRLLLICHEYPPVGGGAATVTAGLARTLGVRHEVTVMTSGYRGLPPSEEAGRVSVVRVPTLRRLIYGASPLDLLAFTLSAMVFGFRLCRRQRFDGCIAIHGIPAAWVALPLARRFRFPYIISLVGGDVPGFLPERLARLHRLVGWATRWTWRGAAALVANSDSLRALAERTAGPLGRTVETVLCGVDTEVHRPSPTPPELPTFLFVGRLSTQKGACYLVEAVGLVHAQLRARARVVIVGDGEEREALERRVAGLGTGDVVTFRGWLAREELAECYRTASVFVLPSLDEGRSQAALEAMASGLAIVATAIDGNAGLVEPGLSGLLVPPRNARALGAALARLVELGPDGIMAMGTASRARAAQFSWQRAAERYLEWLGDESVRVRRAAVC